MSTYNGEKYVKEQILSILSQNKVDVNIIIRDDGSADGTVQIIKELSSQNQKVELIEGDNVGFVGSFSELVNISLRQSGGNYFAFADQDDIWYPDKLYRACKKLDVYPKDVPNLFFSNSDIIDGNGKKTGRQFKQYRPYYTFGNMLLYPTLQGCSMAFNRKALELYNMNPPIISYHDRWMQYICSSMGNVYYEHQSLFAYRVHVSNALGVAKKNGLKMYLKRAKALITADRDRVGYYNMTNEFYQAYKNIIPAHNREVIETYLKYKLTIIDKLKMVFSKDFACPIPKVTEKALLLIHIFQNRI